MGKKDVNGQVPEAMEDNDPGVGEPPQAVTDAAPAAEAEPQAAAEASPDAVAALTRDLQQTRDQLLRQAAEFQNYRRRTDKERAEWVRRGQIQVIEPLLNVLDDFQRSLDASQQVEQQGTPDPAYQALKEGVDLVYHNLLDVLTKLGVESIEAVGQPFDEHLHDAMMQMPAPEGIPPGAVVQEIQRGYRLGDRVLRHARVIVAA